MGNKEIIYFQMFRDVCKVINSTLNLEEVLNLITENIVRALSLKGCTVFLLDKERNRLEVSASYGVSQGYLQKGPLDADKSIAETLKGESILIYDTTSDSRIQYPQEAKKEGVASIFSVPLSVKGQVIGVLRIYTSQPRKFSGNENEFIAGFAEMGSIAIDNARMYHHLKNDHENLINEVHRWFEFGKTT